MTQQNQITLDGAVKGHPFFGNQHVSASGESHTAVRSSQKAKHAEQHGDPKAQKKAHRVAHHAHMAAAEGAQTATTKKYHTTMAKFHGSRAGMTLDSVTFDDAEDFSRGNIVGKIMKGGKQMGRAVIVGDGKAMVFVGESDDQRVVSTATGNAAAWGEDERMIEWLLAPAAQTVADLEYPPAPEGWTLENSVPGMWVTYSKDGVRGVFYTGEKSPNPGAFMIITPDNKLHSSMHPSDGGGEGTVTWEEAFSRANEVAVEFAPAPTPELKPVTYSGLTYEPSMLTEADSVQAWNAALEGNAGDMAAAAKEVYKARLQGTYVETNKGLVLLSGAAWREMKTKLDADTLRCKAIPFIPHLLRGAEGVEEPLAKTRNDYSGFIKFDGIVTVADGTKIRAVAKVGVRLDGQLMYFLRASEGALDSANDEGGGLPQVKSPLSTPSDDQGLPPAMDVILASEEDDVNLVILEAWDKDGNPLDLLAGSGGEPIPEPTVTLEPTLEPNLEPIAEPTPEPTVTPDPAPPPADPKTEDRAFFMSVIDGSHPEILEPELADKLAQAYERHAGDAEITSLFMQAGNAYTQAMLAATEGV